MLIANMLLSNVNSATSGDTPDYGLVGQWFSDGCAWIGQNVMSFLDPFLNWGCKIIIVSCFIIYYCSGERKYIASGIKFGIIFVLYCAIWGAVK